jgi:mannose-6-phosphate isomerase-like protein (cupin superfamily)
MITRNCERAVEYRENMRGGKGTVKLEAWFKPDAFGAKVRLCTQMTLAPGTSVGNHAHEAEDELYIVLSGTGRILENEVWTAIGPGDAILTGKGGAHSVENDGAEPLVIAAVIVQY